MDLLKRIFNHRYAFALREVGPFLALFVVVTGVWAFVEIADEVREGEIQHFDDWAIRSLRSKENPAEPVGPGWLHEVGRDITALGGHAILSLMVLGVVLYLWMQKAYHALWLVLISTVGGMLLTGGLKRLFSRPRPDVVEHLTQVYTSSFPSGHSMLSAAIYLTLGVLLARLVKELRIKAFFIIVAIFLTFIVGLSRVYMGVHYPTDVMAGWSAGLAWALLCWLVAAYLQRRGKVEQDVSSPPEQREQPADAAFPVLPQGPK